MKYKPPEEVQERPQIWACPLRKVKDVPGMRFKTCNRKFFGRLRASQWCRIKNEVGGSVECRQVSSIAPRTQLTVAATRHYSPPHPSLPCHIKKTLVLRGTVFGPVAETSRTNSNSFSASITLALNCHFFGASLQLNRGQQTKQHSASELCWTGRIKTVWDYRGRNLKQTS